MKGENIKDQDDKDQENKGTDSKSAWIWLKRRMHDSHTTHNFIRFFWIIVLSFVVIFCLLVLSYILWSIIKLLIIEDENVKKGRLASQFYIIALSFMMLLYVIQTAGAIWFSAKKESNKIIEISGVYRNVEIKESVMRWTIRDFLSYGGPWILSIVAIFLPVMLSYIPHTMLIFPENVIRNSDISVVTDFETSALIYYMCISIVAVLITVEASILLSLRDIGGIWMGMLLASIIMDIISLFFLNSIGSPFRWINFNLTISGTASYMSLLTLFCFISSFVTIIFARSSREMIFEALVVEKSSDRKDKDTQKSDLS